MVPRLVVSACSALVGLSAALVLCGTVYGQTQPVPRPFPSPTPPAGQPPEPVDPPAPPPAVPPSTATADAEETPTEATLGLPIYPGAQFIASFDAGMGQRYYLFGTATDFLEVVNYYKGILSQRGTLVFEAPATHMFEVGRFREQTMAFPPGVTVKDYTWNNSEGYLNPKPDGQPVHFATVIQIVPVPAQ